MDHRALLLVEFARAHAIPLLLFVLAGASLWSADVREFIGEVRKHWVTLMAGAAGLIATIVAQIRGADISFSDYMAIALFAVVWACFLAWKNKRDELAKFKSPQLRSYFTGNSTAQAGLKNQDTDFDTVNWPTPP